MSGLPPSSSPPGYVVVKEYTRARPGEGAKRQRKKWRRKRKRRGAMRYSL